MRSRSESVATTGSRRTPLLGRVLILAALAGAAACAPPPASAPTVTSDASGVNAPIPGLAVCDRSATAELHLDSRPLTVFVHGCHDTGGRFHELAEAFAADGQQTACFNYDDRRSLEKTSGELARALERVEARVPPGRITVLAHSQGGLVARRALIQERPDPLQTRSGFSYRLLTVSTPFGGIKVTSDCAKSWLRFATLGVTWVVCEAIAGNDWKELPPRSAFITHPGTLLPQVEEVLKVVTDERGACTSEHGQLPCKADSVFSLQEQANPAIDSDARLRAVMLRAGHVEVVGGDGAVPTKLISLLKDRGVLANEPAVVIAHEGAAPAPGTQAPPATALR